MNKLPKYIIDLTSCSAYRHFSSTCKWYILFVNDNFVEKQVLKIVSWIHILLGNNHLGNIFAEAITIKTLPALAKPSAIANCQDELWGLLIPSSVFTCIYVCMFVYVSMCVYLCMCVAIYLYNTFKSSIR